MHVPPEVHGVPFVVRVLSVAALGKAATTVAKRLMEREIKNFIFVEKFGRIRG